MKSSIGTVVFEVLSLVVLGSLSANAQARIVRPSELHPALESARRSGALRIVDSIRSTPVAPSTTAIQLGKGQFLAARTGDSVQVVTRRIPLGMASAGGAKTVDTLSVLPYTFQGLANDNRPMRLQPAIVRDLVLRYQPTTGEFRGSFLVGLQDSSAPALRQSIAGPIPLMLVSNGHDADSITPRTVMIASTNYPLEHVTVIARDPRDSVSIRVVPQFDPRGIVVWLPVHASLVINPPTEASGLGIETVSFLVRVVGASVRDSLNVTLASDRGTLETNRVRIGPSGSAVVHLRSSGIGTAHLSASSPGIDGASIGIQFVWPIGFLIAALLGGAVGGLAKRFSSTRATTRHLMKPVVIGCLIGFVVAVAYYALNISLLAFVAKSPAFDQAAVFALSMLGGLFGIRKPADAPKV